MNKSEFHTTEDGHRLVTASDVGGLVSVVGVGEGRLRYVGGIDGKSGLFCGIDLHRPEGKHNGTFQGFQYFSCREGHGIFAPLYKVRLVDAPLMPSSRTFLLSNQEKLSRSALPALQLKEVLSPALPPRTSSDAMEASTSSTFSMLGNSLLMDGSWEMSDAMLASNNTYILPKRSEPEEEDLMQIEAPASILDNILGTSLVLEESKIGIEHLPIIGSPVHDDEEDEEELETPIIERRPPPQAPPPPALPAMEEEDDEEPELIGDHFADHSDDGVSRHSTDTGYHGESEQSGKVDANKTPTSPSTASVATAATASRRMSEKQKEVEKKADVPRRADSSLLQVRVAPPPPPPPKFPVKPKPPSKSQLMMERIKASIEAEKIAPKKSSKPRVSLLPQAPPPAEVPPPHATDENVGMSPPDSAASSTRSAKPPSTPLRVLNAAASAPSARSQAAPRKPRVSLLPPPVTKKDESSLSAPKAGPITNGTAKTKAADSKLPAKGTKASVQFPTSSFAPKVGGARQTQTATAMHGRARDDENQLRILRHNALIAQAFAVYSEHERKKAESQRQREQKEIVDLRTELEGVLRRLSEAERRNAEEMEKLHNCNEKGIQILRDQMAKQSDEREKALTQSLEEERARHETEIADLTRRHQQTCALLDEKNAEAERAIVALQEEKKALQTALANDHDTKVQMLSKEISSLNTALVLKSSEMKELRLRNQQLVMRVDEIPGKELEISKLRHKMNELKTLLDQKMDVEKQLVMQNEELRRSARNSSQMSESYKKSMDVLLYQLKTAHEGAPESPSTHLLAGVQMDESVCFSSTGVRLRGGEGSTPRGATDSRPYSYTLPSSARLSTARTSTDSAATDPSDALSRSLFSMYSSQARPNSILNDDIIYAPDQVLTSSVRRKLSFDEEEAPTGDSADSRPAVTHAQCDSGIGI